MNEIDAATKKRNYYRVWAIALALFLLALAVRIPGLGETLTVDEPFWLERSNWFLGGLLVPNRECPSDDRGEDFSGSGLNCTFHSTHPGVTTMWAGSLGLLLHYWQTGRFTNVDLSTFLRTSTSYSDDPTLIVPTRLPIAVISALFIPLFYLLIRRLLTEQLAIIAAMLVALNPFHIALSRILHHDALVTTFMVLSLLAIIGYWLRDWSRYWLFISAILAGLAFLSKPVGWFLIPYLGVLAVLTLYYRWQRGCWKGWPDIWSLAGAGILWGITAGSTVFIFFPAMWVIPREVIQTIYNKSTDLALAGHGHYFLGTISQDPGILFYPVGWLLRASPLEIVGLFALGIAFWRRPVSALRQQMIDRPVEVALFLFLLLFLIFETTSPKKNVRYLLPAFPEIAIFTAFGLLWLFDRLTRFGSGRISQWQVPLLCGLILLVQGWFAYYSYPYYFTYFNPLLGGTSGAARLMDVSWGEGMNEAAAFLNRLPQAESLTVATCRSNSTFEPFFKGNVLPCASVEDIIEADYVVYYIWDLQLKKSSYYFPYFRDHYSPVHQVTIDGLDYALIYRNPVQFHVSQVENRLEGLLTVYGFDFEDNGTFKLYWHNIGVDHQQLVLGLTPPAGGETYWLPCEPAPGFTANPLPPDSIVESFCPLATIEIPADVYDVQLGVNNGSGIDPIESSALAFVSVAPNQVELVKEEAVLPQISAQGLPQGATPLDITYSDRMRLIGYQLEPPPEPGGAHGDVTLYWQLIRRPDIGLAQAFQLDIQFFSKRSNNEPLASVSHPLFTQPVNPAETARGSIIPMAYPLPEYIGADTANIIRVCLRIASTGQIVPATVDNTTEQIECVPIPAQKGMF